MGKCALLVCLFFLERRSDAPSTLAVRRRQRRRFLSPLLHGFTLRVSPAVKHGTPPPEARVDLCGCSMPAMRRCQRREYLCVDAAEEERWYEHLQTYAICKGGGRRNASTCSPTVPRGDTPCVTAGDARRVNPWKVDKTILRHWRCRTAATPTHLSFSLNACSATPPETRMELYSCYSSSKKILFPYT